MQNEKRLIDANVLCDEVNKSKHNNPHSPGMVRVNHRNEHDHFLRMILDAPTVDAAEVVRCKDCRQSEKYCGKLFCGRWRADWNAVSENDFCSYGERRENDSSKDTTAEDAGKLR